MNVCKYVHRTVQNGEHFKVNCSVFILNWLKNNCFKLLWKHFSHLALGVITSLSREGEEGAW